MHNLTPEKLITIITTDVLEDQLIAKAKKCGVSGYTIQRARGGGSSGIQSGMLDIDTNITFKIVIPEERLSNVLDGLQDLINKRYHLTVFVSDVSVLRGDKFNVPLK
jgi:nitrogen regulatory protein PII